MILLTGAGERSTVAGHKLTLAQSISLAGIQSFDGPLTSSPFSGVGKSNISVIITGAGGRGDDSHQTGGNGNGGGGGACVTKTLPLMSVYRMSAAHDYISGYAKVTNDSGLLVYALAPDGQDGNSVATDPASGGGTAAAIALGGAVASGDTQHTGGNGGTYGGDYYGCGGGGQAATISSNGQDGETATDGGITVAQGGGIPGAPGSGGHGGTLSSPPGADGQSPGGGGGGGDGGLAGRNGGNARFSWSWSM